MVLPSFSQVFVFCKQKRRPAGRVASPQFSRGNERRGSYKKATLAGRRSWVGLEAHRHSAVASVSLRPNPCWCAFDVVQHPVFDGPWVHFYASRKDGGADLHAAQHEPASPRRATGGPNSPSDPPPVPRARGGSGEVASNSDCAEACCLQAVSTSVLVSLMRGLGPASGSVGLVGGCVLDRLGSACGFLTVKEGRERI